MARSKTGNWILGVSLLTVLGAGSALGNVSLKNGNFFVGYIDVVYPGGFEPKIERVYNSKSTFHGIFGWGWGTEYEVYLTVAPDGSVVVHEYGSGAENRFSPVGTTAANELDKAVMMIAGAMQKAGRYGDAQKFEAYKKRLRADATFRNKEWEDLRRRGLVKPIPLPVNSKLVSNHFNYQYMTKVADGYVRAFDNGRVERFDDNGKIRRISDKNNNFIDFTYSKDGKIDKIVDNFNRKMFLKFNSNGYVDRIHGENGKEAQYRYNGLGELVYSKDVENNIFTFKYDGNQRHNLEQIGYSDKTSLVVSYYGRDNHENVKTVKDRDGSVTEYSYKDFKDGSGHLLVGVSVKGKDGKAISNSSYEYFIKHNAAGEEYTERMVTTLDGDRTDTVYDPRFGLPTSIKRGDEQTSFQYDIKGHVVKKTTSTEITELSYDPKVGKVNKVVRTSKATKKLNGWSVFGYDSKGNLITAKNSDGKEVGLLYDTNGRISRLLDKKQKRIIQFKYNENSKPIEISDPSLGSITVSYTNSGEIKKVESSAGRKIALQVTSAFQNLLDIIRPAGVSLSF